MQRALRLGLATFALVGVAGAIALWRAAEPTSKPPVSSPEAEAPPPHARRWSTDDAEYTGTARCGECHEDALAAYRGSHHDRAIERPSTETVLAPFDGETFVHDGVRTTFQRSGANFVVRTPGVNGDAHEYPVAYTFGVHPLQQYLLDVGDGRLQAFTVAWDSRARDDGGQRYFDLYPDEALSPQHSLHWTRPAQNWNFVCADCHSTAFEKGYDETKDTFQSSWAELDVGCEACHGPGSVHVEWAEAGAKPPVAGLVVSLERAPQWTIPEGARTAAPRAGDAHQVEINACAPCHSRRHQLAEGHRPDEPLLDAYRPELLRGALYHDDGQIDEEVYVYGSFLQSRMFHAGVRCSDCHEPHSLALRREGNALCTTCHSKESYDQPAHHHHPGGAATACVECHMPDKTYMRVDRRRDHSLRIPRPDLAAEIDAPDPCTSCHAGQTQAWAAARLRDWFGDERRPHYGEALHAVRYGEPGAVKALVELARDASAPAIVRATALGEFASVGGPAALEALKDGATSEEPLIRLGVTDGARGLAPTDRLAVLRPLLDDPLLAVRSEAARSLAEVPRTMLALSAGDRALLEDALGELLRVERGHADRADAWLRIALVQQGRGQVDAAVQSLERALEVDPRFTPAMVNLADLHRVRDKEAAAAALLQRAVESEPESAEAWHALGLSLVRRGRGDEAVGMLRRAAELRPDNARFAYVYAVALADGGDPDGALRVLQGALDRQPNDATLLQALLQYAKKTGNEALVAEAVERLQQR